ncbi:FecCD family ABC transporter permease [Mobilicoccus pelagius]|uniref:Putative iron-siderophore ABC transporter permease protein n=1 Tax=Mobilicoccus pelagius NBRC 104925 TaxID=1089455 RepID=H5UMW4_9MICO|nr:iron ABC transporter permease [Mobilicoccus pelagius]GAB47072.1 putative iron-siderophore ABC transporter permease protein [Mobilicoccus pelagius NBRC 104925]
MSVTAPGRRADAVPDGAPSSPPPPPSAAGATAVTPVEAERATQAAGERFTALRRRGLRRAGILLVLGALVVVAFLAGLATGPLGYGLGDVARAVLSPESVDAQMRSVVWGLRLPPALLAVLVGAALALGGLEMQTILDNPLAEPFTLGVSAAAAFGAALAIVLGISLPIGPQHTLTVFAGGMALLTAVVISAVSMWRGASTETVVLFGIAMVFGFQALLTLMQYRASTESLQQIVFWSMGSMQRATWTAVAVVAISLAVAVPWFALNGWKLTAMRFGDARARALGVDVTRMRVVSLVVVSLLAAVAVSFVGIIGFVGLVAPHVARVLVGEDQRFLLPASILSGAALLAGAHALSLVVVPGVAVPVGILTATVGVPVFVAIILLRRRAAFGGAR